MNENDGRDARGTTGTNRREFGRTALAATIGAAAATIWSGGTPAEAQGVTDIDVLNFALNLE